MKILFDYKIFYQQRYGGISNYFYQLSKEFIKREIDLKITSQVHKNEYLKKIPNSCLVGNFFTFLPHKLNFITENFNHFNARLFIKKFQPNIIHETYYSKKKYYSNLKTVCTAYDMINEIYPNYSPNFKYVYQIKKDTFKRANKIICISNKTKEDLIKYFDVETHKIEVTHLSSTFENYKLEKSNYKKFNDCLLFVGSRYGYKNFERFLSAYSKSNYLKNNFRIIFYGGEKPNSYDYKVINKNNINFKNILFFNDLDFSLSYMYSNVLALIYPSMYEGFGIPILEAMTLGCPVISSNGGALREVGGDGLQYFNPNEIDDIKNKLENFLNSENFIKEKVNYGFERSKKFSWKKCAEETLSIYKKI